MVSNNDDNTDVMELAESLLLLDLSEQVPTTDTLPIDAPKQQDVIREINESHGVETEPIPSHPILTLLNSMCRTLSRKVI